MDDLISRQALNKLLDEAIQYAEEINDSKSYFAYCAVQAIVNKLPSAEKKGKWTKYTLPDCTYFICSLCGWKSIDSKSIYDDDGWYVDEVGMTYCPNCGARMERSEE